MIIQATADNSRIIKNGKGLVRRAGSALMDIRTPQLMHISCVTENAFSSGPRPIVQSLRPEAKTAADLRHLLIQRERTTCVFRGEWVAEEMTTGYELATGRVGGLDRGCRTGGAGSTNPPGSGRCEA